MSILGFICPGGMCPGSILPISEGRSKACLLPTRSEEKGIMGVWSIPVAILPYCQDMTTSKLIDSFRVRANVGEVSGCRSV